MKHSKLEIKTIDQDSIYCQDLIDGHVVHGVRSIRFEKKAQSMPVVSIDMNCIDMTVDSPFITQLEGKDGENEIIFKFKDDNEPK